MLACSPLLPTCMLTPGQYLDVGLLQVMGPGGEQVLAHLLVEVACVGDEGCGQQAVPGDGGHLILERLARFFPPLAFS